MGHQLNFFAMPADLPDLEIAIRAIGDICFLAAKSPTGELLELDTLASGSPVEPPGLGTCFIVRREHVAAVRTCFSKPQDCWFIVGSESPVIEFNPGVFSGTKLSRGRAYFASDLRFRPEMPGAEFVRWGDRVLSRIKKALTTDPALGPAWVYYGAAALDWIENSGATMTGGAVSLAIPENG